MTTHLNGPFHVARYLPQDPQHEEPVVEEHLSQHQDLADAIISARRVTLHPVLPLKPEHACVYVEHDHLREIVWVSI